MLLIHGAGASTHSWSGLFAILSETFEVIALDLPGHGFTQTRKGFVPTLENTANSIAALLRELDVSPEILIGHSAGAAIAIALADSRQCEPKKIISINGALRPFPGAMGVFAPIAAKAMTLGGAASRLMAWSARDVSRVERLLRGTGSDPVPESLACYAALMRHPAHVKGTLSMMAHWRLDRIEAACRRLTMPVQFITGDRDQAVPPDVSKSMANITPKGSLAELPGLGHLVHEEAPELVASLIRNGQDLL